MLIKRISLFLLILSVAAPSLAQKRKRIPQERSPKQEIVYDDHTYLPEIKTVQLYPSSQESTLPVIDLFNNEQLILTFDDLRGEIRNYYYSIEHCGADWKPSRLNQLEYAHSYNEDPVLTYRSSINTLQPYTHYQVQFPSENVRPKLPGNYLLKVYEDSDKSRLILTRKFYVVSPAIAISPQLVPSMQAGQRQTNQKLNLELSTSAITINNPYQDVKILVMQNQRPDIQEWLTAPMFVNNTSLIYNNMATLDFGGANEFRFIDLRSMQLASERVAKISIDSNVRVTLMADENYGHAAYASVFDENGVFYIRNQERADAGIESEYAQVTFSLVGSNVSEGDVYIVGGFNRFQYTDDYKMHYNASTGVWSKDILLKQGLYDYEYAHVSPSGEVNPTAFSGNHFETGNHYHILVYVRRPGTTWDELLGYALIDTENR